MPQISKGDTFTNGEQVTGARLNQLVDSSTLLAGAITEQGALTANTVAANDSFLMYDLSANALRKPTASDILNSNLPITSSSISGNGGVDLVITPPAGKKVDVAGALEAESNNVIGNETVGGNLSVGGTLTVVGGINGTSAVKIATGTTAERPASPVAGQLRFNTTSNALEVYSGSTWINGVTSGSALFDGTVNITGVIQYNGTPVYGMYEVVKYVTNPTPALTKGADEIWVVNLRAWGVPWSSPPSIPTLTITSTTTIYGDANDIIAGAGVAGGDNDTLFSYYDLDSDIIIPAGTTFSAKTFTGNWMVIFITKYKTA
jgi:hypothetical protein